MAEGMRLIRAGAVAGEGHGEQSDRKSPGWCGVGLWGPLDTVEPDTTVGCKLP